MPPSLFNSRYRKKVFGALNDIQYRKCGDRPSNYTDEKCVGCACTQTACSPILSSPIILQAENKRTYNISRIPASEYGNNKGALTVLNGSRNNQGQTWNQSSDRAIAHQTKNPVPSHGNSTSRSLTRLRPGACSPGGRGVDIKHNSYARYLQRRKGGAMIGGPYVGNQVPSSAVVNNKVQKQNSVGCQCN